MLALLSAREEEERLPQKTASNVNGKKEQKSVYRNDLKFSERLVWTNSADPDQTAPRGESDQGLHYLQNCLHLLDALLYGKTSFSSFRMITVQFSCVRKFRKFTMY